MFKILNKLFQRNKQKHINKSLIDTGKKIIVSIDECEVKPVTNFEEGQLNGALETTMLDALAGKDQLEQSKREGCYLIYRYKTESGDERKLMSPFIAKDSITLAFILQQRKAIDIYLNPVDGSEYYFDLEFLNA